MSYLGPMESEEEMRRDFGGPPQPRVKSQAERRRSLIDALAAERRPGPTVREVMQAMRNLDRNQAGWRDVQVIIDASNQTPDESWRDETVTRASGEVICSICSLPYWKHPQPAKDEVPTLVRACDGRLLKL